MKHGSVLTQTEIRRICIMGLNAAAVVGIVIGGAAAVFSSDFSNAWLHQFFAPVYSGNTVFEVFRNTFLSSLLFLALTFILGFFALGQPIGIGMLIYRGFGIGFSVAAMYSQRGFEAVSSVIILVIPKAVAICFLSSLAVREMIRLSNSQFRYLFTENAGESGSGRTVRLYCVKFAVISLIMLIISVIDAALNYFFMDLI